MLFIPHERIGRVTAALHAARQGHLGVWIEHRELKKPSGLRYEIAERWIKWFKTEGIHYCSFKVFAVDQEGYRQFPYRGDDGYPFHIWKNTLTSFVAGIQWSLPKTKGILLDVLSDSSGDQDFVNALDALPSSIKADMIARRRRQRHRHQARLQAGSHRELRLAPLVRVNGAPRMVSSRPRSGTSTAGAESDLVQLTDILLGVLWDTVQARKVDAASRAGRLVLASEFKEIVSADIQLPWAARLPLGRAISVSVYPDENGRAYRATVLSSRPGQQPLPLPPELIPTRRERREMGLIAEHTADTPTTTGEGFEADFDYPSGIGFSESGSRVQGGLSATAARTPRRDRKASVKR